MTLRTDLVIAQLPSPIPNMGGLLGKNTIIVDPDFGTQIVRLTDGSSGKGTDHRSLQTQDDANHVLWNTDDTMIAVRNTGGATYIIQFNPATMQGTQLPGSYTGDFLFSATANNIAYNINGTGSSPTVVNKLTFALVGGVWTLQSTVQLCDFASILPAGFVALWVSEFNHSQDDSTFSVGFAAGVQGTGYLACVYKVGSGFRMLNTQTGAITGAWGATGTWNQTSPYPTFHIHEVYQTPNPRYCVINPRASDGTGNMIWDVATLNVGWVNVSGHNVRGYLDIYDGGPGGGQWAAAAYANPSATYKIIPLAGLPAGQSPRQKYQGDQHGAFGAVSVTDDSIFWVVPATKVTPFTSCWMNEVHGYVSNGTAQEGTVYRACHTFNTGLSTEFIVANAIGCPSQTNNFVAFTSDWMGTLGSTAGGATGTVGLNARGDVFVVRTAANAPGGPPTLSVATAALAGGGVSSPYGQNLDAIGGVSPYSWAVTAGSLPAGLSLSGGVISGTPTAPGTASLTITVIDSATPTPATAAAGFSLAIAPRVAGEMYDIVEIDNPGMANHHIEVRCRVVQV